MSWSTFAVKPPEFGCGISASSSNSGGGERDRIWRRWKVAGGRDEVDACEVDGKGGLSEFLADDFEVSGPAEANTGELGDEGPAAMSVIPNKDKSISFGT